jgi:hypothetical protein
MSFTPGIALCEAFYWNAVRPILDDAFPALLHSAALIGPGSEVLGYDTPMSADHHWGPRVMLFLTPADLEAHGAQIYDTLANRLPVSFADYPTNFSPPVEANGTRLLQAVAQGPVAHRVECFSLSGFWQEYLAIPPFVEPDVLDWLTMEEHRLLAVTAGAVFHDGLAQADSSGGLQAARARLAHYPRGVWLYLLAAQWAKIGQEEPFIGRAGSVGDELGSRVIAARMAGAVMRLGFLMERVYAPYSKWFGTAFSRLTCAAELLPLLTEMLQAEQWKARQSALCRVLEACARLHNCLALTAPLPEQASPFHGRPFNVIHGEMFAEALWGAIRDEHLRSLPRFVGSVNQFVESVDVVERPTLCHRLRGVYSEKD